MKTLASIFLAFVAFSIAAFPALALDIDRTKEAGWRLSEALAIGAQGDWPAAQAMVSGGDPVLGDIVLWRKLRAGEGSFTDYQNYISRRPEWPGRTQLEKAVGLAPEASYQPPLTGIAASNFRTFNNIYRSKDYDAAAEMLGSVTHSYENLGVPARWADRRRRLARRLARNGEARMAYRLASEHFLSASDGYAYSDLEWLSGWIALRFLKDPGRATGHFERFSASVETPISLGRAGYWTGRAYEALGNRRKADQWYGIGAQYQTSFYGQLAAARINAAGDPRLASGALINWRTHPALDSDDVRAALMLHYAGQDRLAFVMFESLAKRLEGESALAALGALTLDLDKPHYAVRIAKAAARRGMVLHPIYYPLHDLASYATTVEPALAMAIARQETELNPRAISPAGARGLMQLMPATAKRVAGWIDEEYSRSRLIEDWRYNARLGQTYLSRRTLQFGGSYVMAAAAYNAGANRVDQWLAAYGDPRLPGSTTDDMIDWMENIPFRETRNYVQRVMESLYTYRARLTGNAGEMTLVRDLARGVR